MLRGVDQVYTGTPSLPHEIAVLIARGLRVVLAPVGGVLALVPLKVPFLTDGVPRSVFTRGLDVMHSDFDGMPVVTLKPPRPTGKIVIAVHGGSYVGNATMFHWWTYGDLARTGATVVVPAYTLSPVGNAETEVPRMTDFIARTVDEHGADDVSVLGDSAGGGFALIAVQELLRRGAATPGRLVLLSPWLDVSVSDPRSGHVDDVLLDREHMIKYGSWWAGGLAGQDPLVSPLFGSLQGLPPTVVYSSSRDVLSIDAVRLRDRVLAEDVPNVAFRMRQGLMHAFALYAPLPDARAERANLYLDLGL
jgi:acetyl esterase/lipase